MPLTKRHSGRFSLLTFFIFVPGPNCLRNGNKGIPVLLFAFTNETYTPVERDLPIPFLIRLGNFCPLTELRTGVRRRSGFRGRKKCPEDCLMRSVVFLNFIRNSYF